VSETADWMAAVPAMAAAGGALLILALDAAAGRTRLDGRATRRRGLGLALCATLALLIGVAAALAQLASGDPREGGLPAVTVVIVGLFGVLAIWLSSTYLMARRLRAGEYFVLLLLSLAGAFVAVSADRALTLWVGLELMALPAHVLAGFDRGRRRSNEAALKAFLLGALASATLLFGLALLFGATGRLDYAGLREGLVAGRVLDTAGLGLVLAGLALKAGLAPFHQWAPDVDEGAPASSAAFVSVCVRGAALLVVLRVVVAVVPEGDEATTAVFAVLAVLGIVIGSLMAIVQRNVRRLIAWAGVAHGGTMLLAFVCGDAAARGAMLFYLLAVGLATFGAIGVVLTLAGGGREVERLEDLAGIGQARPGLAALMTLFVLSLAGLPVTAGFWGKWLLVRALVGTGHVPLAVVALLGSVIALYAYMRVPAMLYMREAPEQDTPDASTSELLVLLICAGATLFLGVMPDPTLPVVGSGLLELLGQASVSPS